MNPRDIIQSIISGTLVEPKPGEEPEYRFVSSPEQPLPDGFVRQHTPAGMDFCVLRKPIISMTRHELYAVIGWMRELVHTGAFEKYVLIAGNGWQAVDDKK